MCVKDKGCGQVLKKLRLLELNLSVQCEDCKECNWKEGVMGQQRCLKHIRRMSKRGEEKCFVEIYSND